MGSFGPGSQLVDFAEGSRLASGSVRLTQGALGLGQGRRGPVGRDGRGANLAPRPDVELVRPLWSDDHSSLVMLR